MYQKTLILRPGEKISQDILDQLKVIQKAKVAFRKDRQRKNERATAERQAAQRAAANERANIRR